MGPKVIKKIDVAGREIIFKGFSFRIKATFTLSYFGGEEEYKVGG